MFSSAVEGLQSFKQKQLQALSDNPLYIPIQARHTTFSQETPSDLMDSVKSFLSAEDPKKVLLILGEAGYGKSLFFQTLARQRWIQYQDDHAIPIFVSLPCLDQTNRIMEDTLENHGFTPDQVNQLKTEKRFIFILDGYDEMHRLEQIYLNNRWQEWQVKIIISCRAQALYHVEQYESLFAPYQDDVPQYNLLQQLHVAEFSESQIDEYLKRYAILSSQKEMGDVESIFSIARPPGGIEADLFLDEKRSADEIKNEPIEGINSEKIITKTQLESVPGLMKLVKTPFILRITLDALPDVLKDFAEGKSEGIEEAKRNELTQAKLYDVFVNRWFIRQEKKLKEAKVIDDSLDPKPMFLEYCYALSSSMLKNNVTSINLNTKNLAAKEEWLSLVGDEAELARSACLITRYSSNEFGFMHASFIEYFVVRKAAENARLSQEKIEEEIIQWETGDPFYEEILADNKVYIQNLVDRPEHMEKIKKYFYQIIIKSKDDERLEFAAANAITILNAYGEVFSAQNFTAVRIRGADLSGAILDHTIFCDADLRNVNLKGTWLRNADFTKAKMEGVKFGEKPFLKILSGVTSISYSADKKWLAVGCEDKKIYIHEAETSKLNQVLEGHTSAGICVSFGAGDLLVSGSWDKTLRIWDVKLGKCLQTLEKHEDSVHSVSFGYGDIMASGSQDKTVRVWDAKKGECLQTLKGHRSNVSSVAFGPGDVLASGSEDQTVCVWNVKQGNCLHTFYEHSSAVTSVSFGPGDLLASGSYKMICISNWNQGLCLQILEGDTGYVRSLSFDGGNLLASGGDDKTVRVWNVRQGECLQILEGHIGGITSVSFSARDILVSGSYDNTVRVWNVKHDKVLQIYEGHTNGVRCISFGSVDILASGSNDGTVRVWNVRQGKCLQTLKGHLEGVTCVAFGFGDTLASGSYDCTVRIWDIQLGQCLQILKGHKFYIQKVFFGPGDKLILEDMTEEVSVWNIKHGQCLRQLKVSSKFFRPKDFIDMVSKKVQPGDIQKSKCLQELIGYSGFGVDCISFGPGNFLASGCRDNSVRVWDVKNGKCLEKLEGHTSAINALSFSPDGILASGSNDRTVRLWDINRLCCLYVILGFRGSISSLAWKQNTEGLYLATGSYDKAVRYWQVYRQDKDVKVVLRWSTHQASLTVRKTNIAGAIGLTDLDYRILNQRGAIGGSSILQSEEKKSKSSLANSSIFSHKPLHLNNNQIKTKAKQGQSTRSLGKSSSSK